MHFVTILAGRVALALDNAGLFSDLARAERERAALAWAEAVTLVAETGVPDSAYEAG